MSVLCLDDSDTHLSGHHSCVCHVTVERTDATVANQESAPESGHQNSATRKPPFGYECSAP